MTQAQQQKSPKAVSIASTVEEAVAETTATVEAIVEKVSEHDARIKQLEAIARAAGAKVAEHQAREAVKADAVPWYRTRAFKIAAGVGTAAAVAGGGYALYKRGKAKGIDSVGVED